MIGHVPQAAHQRLVILLNVPLHRYIVKADTHRHTEHSLGLECGPGGATLRLACV